MKNFRLLMVLFAFAVAFTACKKDEEKPMTTEQKMVGKWSVSRASYKNYEDGSLTDSDSESGAPGDYVEFNSNKTLVTSFDGEIETSSYSILSESAFSIMTEGGPVNASIVKLDSKNFVFTATTSYYYDGTDYKTVMTYELTK